MGEEFKYLELVMTDRNKSRRHSCQEVFLRLKPTLKSKVLIRDVKVTPYKTIIYYNCIYPKNFNKQFNFEIFLSIFRKLQ